MAVKRELGARRQLNEPKERDSTSKSDPVAKATENIDTLVSSFLAELTDLSSEMKSQAGTPAEKDEAPAGKPGTRPGAGEVKIPKSLQLHEDAGPNPDLEIINDQIEQSLAELEGLKSAGLNKEERVPAPEAPPEPQEKPADAKAAPAPLKREQARPIAPPPQPDPEDAWDRLEIFRDRFSSPASRQWKNYIIIGAVVLIGILAIYSYRLLTSYEAVPGDVAPATEPAAGAAEQNAPPATSISTIAAGDPKPAGQPSITAPARASAAAAKPIAKQSPPASGSGDRKTPAATQTVKTGDRPENQDRSAAQQQTAASPTPPPAINTQSAAVPEPKPAAAVPTATSSPVIPEAAPASGSVREKASAPPKPEPPPNAAVPEPAAQPRRRTPVMAEAITRVQPEYPAMARQQRVSGRVEVEADVNERGDVVRAKAVSGPMLLRGAAEQAVTKWKFKPASIEGVDISSKARIAVNFTLQ